MKIALLALTLFTFFVKDSLTTNCYVCGDGNYDVCKKVTSKTPTYNAMDEFGCYTSYKNVLDQNGVPTNNTRVLERGHLYKLLNDTKCDGKENNYVTYECCNDDLCNSSGGLKATAVTILAGFSLYAIYNVM